MNYIFLDIDGCLLPGRSLLNKDNRKITRATLRESKPVFDPIAVTMFNLWAKYGKAKIVFSTNWEMMYSTDELKQIMEDNGLEFNYHDECATPKKMSSNRNHEIQWWLQENAKPGDKFIAVDDDTNCSTIDTWVDTYSDLGLLGKWIEVDFSNGISLQNFYDGCKALDIDMEDLDEKEYGIKKLTAEEKQKRSDALDMLASCIC